MSETASERRDGRRDNQLRPVQITPQYLKPPLGSALIEMGDTKVICVEIFHHTQHHNKCKVNKGRLSPATVGYWDYDG